MHNRAHGRFFVVADNRWFALGLFSFCLGFFLRVLQFFLARCINNSTSAFGLRLLLWLFWSAVNISTLGLRLLYGIWLAAAVPAFGMRLLFDSWSAVAYPVILWSLFRPLICGHCLWLLACDCCIDLWLAVAVWAIACSSAVDSTSLFLGFQV